ncbi:MAG: hypothetical protein ACYC04_07950 [Sulfurovum sp.]
MTKFEALKICKDKDLRVKLDWWNNNMYFYFCKLDNCYKSGPGVEIEIKFLQDGYYEILPWDDSHLGGLFSI